MKLLKDRKHNIVYLICYCLLSALFLSIVLHKGYTIIAYNTPKELREMNTVVFAHQFAHANNPYSYAALNNSTPPPTSIYGLIVPLLMSPFIHLFSLVHLNSLQACELLTLAVEVAGAVFFYRLLNRKTNHILLSIIGTILFYTCYWRYSAFGGAFPDQWGLSVTIILMDLLHLDEQKQQYRPFVYAACLIILFYTKQYFVLVTAGLCIYLYIYSRKDLVRLIIYGAVMGCASVVLVYILFPLYFTEVFPIAQGQTLTGDSSYSLNQIKKLSLYYGPIVLFAVIGIIRKGYGMIKNRRMRGIVTYELCQIILSIVPLYKIAENQGTNYTYYLQLWYPYIILFGVVSLSELVDTIIGYKDRIMSNSGKYRITMISLVFIYILTAYSVIRVLPSFRCTLMTREQREAWNHAYDILDRYSADGEILVTMLLSEYCIENGIATSNYGQAEYNNADNLKNYKDNKIWRNVFLFRHTEELLQSNISYNQMVKDNIYNQIYSCIAVVYAGEYHLKDDDFTDAGYHVIATEELMSGDQCWYTTFYALTD